MTLEAEYGVGKTYGANWRRYCREWIRAQSLKKRWLCVSPKYNFHGRQLPGMEWLNIAGTPRENGGCYVRRANLTKVRYTANVRYTARGRLCNRQARGRIGNRQEPFQGCSRIFFIVTDDGPLQCLLTGQSYQNRDYLLDCLLCIEKHSWPIMTECGSYMANQQI